MQDLPKLRESLLSLADGVALLRLDRHDLRNALTGTALADDIISVCDWVNRETDVGALVVTGEGSAFSAGGNIKDMASRSGMFAGEGLEIQDAYRQGIQRLTRAVHRVEVPVIAAINGPAIGAGLDLACMCDIRLAADGARLAESFVNLGLVPGDGGAWFLPRLVGPQRAAELSFSGRPLGAAEAHSIGLVLEVLPADRLLPRALEMARGFAAKPRQALRLTKRLLRAAPHLSLDDFLDHCAALQALAHHSQEHQRALAAALAPCP